jgi:hypothetical protein
VRKLFIFSVLSQFGVNSFVIWEFAAAVLAVMFVVALILMAVEMIKRLIE